MKNPKIKISYNEKVKRPTMDEFKDIHGKSFLIFPKKEREVKMKEVYNELFKAKEDEERQQEKQQKGLKKVREQKVTSKENEETKKSIEEVKED